MKIKTVIIKNIFSYFDENKISFAKNQTAIIGENGLGKSNFLKSLKLAFGKKCKNRDFILNKNSNELKASIFVELEKFSILKTWNFEKSNNSTTSIFLSETLEIVDFTQNIKIFDDEAQDLISEYFPLEILDFIFFDGEIADVKQFFDSKNIKKILELAFNIDILSYMKSDLKKVKNRFITEISAIELDKYKKLKLDKFQIEEQINQLNLDLKENLKLNKNTFNQLQKNQNLLKKEDKNIYKLEKELSEAKKEKDENLEKFQEINLFTLPLILNKKLLDNVKKRSKFLQIDDKNIFEDRFSKFSELIISDQNSLTKEDLLNHFYSIFGDSILDLDFNLSKEKLKNTLKNITSSKNRLNELEKKKNSILSFNLSEKVENLKLEIKNLENQEKIISEDIMQIKNKLEALQVKLKEIDSQIREEFVSQKKNYGTINSIETIEKLIPLAENIYQNEIEKILKSFNKKFQTNLEFFYNKYKNIGKIEINSEFNISIFNNNLELLSAGQKHILIFIFIFTILEVYKITDFIFVDTPFGRLSKENRIYLKEIYEKFNQLIVLATNSEEEVFKNSNYETFKIKLFEKKGVQFWV